MSASLRRAPVRPPSALCHAIELIEAQSALSQHACAPIAEVRRLGLRSERLGSAAIILTRKSTNLLYNRVIGLGQASSASRGQLEQALEWARDHRVKRVGVDLGDAFRPPALHGWLRDLEFTQRHPAAKLWRDASTLPRKPKNSQITVRCLRPTQGAAWVDVVSQVWRTFGSRRPWFEARVAATGWRHYLAHIDGEPVAAGALFVGDVRGRFVGHLVDGVTLKPWRRQGAQSAIIRQRISDGLRLGCQLFTSETAPPLPRMPLVSFRNLTRQGFELAYVRESWIRELS